MKKETRQLKVILLKKLKKLREIRNECDEDIHVLKVQLFKNDIKRMLITLIYPFSKIYVLTYEYLNPELKEK